MHTAWPLLEAHGLSVGADDAEAGDEGVTDEHRVEVVVEDVLPERDSLHDVHLAHAVEVRVQDVHLPVQHAVQPAVRVALLPLPSRRLHARLQRSHPGVIGVRVEVSLVVAHPPQCCRVGGDAVVEVADLHAGRRSVQLAFHGGGRPVGEPAREHRLVGRGGGGDADARAAAGGHHRRIVAHPPAQRHRGRCRQRVALTRHERHSARVAEAALLAGGVHLGRHLAETVAHRPRLVSAVPPHAAAAEVVPQLGAHVVVVTAVVALHVGDENGEEAGAHLQRERHADEREDEHVEAVRRPPAVQKALQQGDVHHRHGRRGRQLSPVLRLRQHALALVLRGTSHTQWGPRRITLKVREDRLRWTKLES